MNIGYVKEIYAALEQAGVRIWLDGGWGVDALLGRQTRAHADLDIALQEQDVEAYRAIIEARGFRAAPREYTKSWNFVHVDEEGRELDAHVIVFDAQMNGVMGPVEYGLVYPAGALDGTGVIDGVKVRCVAPSFAVRFHTGYVPRGKDYADVKALCDRFGIEFPSEYARLTCEDMG